MQTELPTDQPAEAPVATKEPAATVLVPGRYGPRPMAVKSCARCGQRKLVSAFRKAPGKGAGHRPECRSCECKLGSAEKPAMLPPEAHEKRCARCEQVFSLECFRPDSRGRFGKGCVCATCWVAAHAERGRREEIDLEQPDELLGTNSEAREQRAALGIAIAHATCPQGQRRTHEELAAYADVSPEAIRRLEASALKKVRFRLEQVLREAGLRLREVAP